MMNQNNQYITISPKDFIQEPYIRCPKCLKETFGVLSIFSKSYTRRCSECFFPKGSEPSVRYPLPKLDKKIIYLDQNIISNMMKSLNSKTNAYQKNKLLPFWKSFFEKIHELVKLQLIICPDSNFHQYESLLSQHYAALKRMYELLSNKVSFYNHETIHRFQIIYQFKKWLGEEVKDLTIDSITHGNINDWQERFIISMRSEGWPELIEELKKNKEIIVTALIPLFQRWQTEKNRGFDFWFNEEVQGHANYIIDSYKKQLSNFAMANSGTPIEPGLLIPNMATVLLDQMIEILKKKINSAEVAHTNGFL